MSMKTFITFNDIETVDGSALHVVDYMLIGEHFTSGSLRAFVVLKKSPLRILSTPNLKATY